MPDTDEQSSLLVVCDSHSPSKHEHQWASARMSRYRSRESAVRESDVLLAKGHRTLINYP